jgi:hypothetical protein
MPHVTVSQVISADPNNPKHTIVSPDTIDEDRLKLATDNQIWQQKMNSLLQSKNPNVQTIALALKRSNANPSDFATVHDSLRRLQVIKS